MTVSNQPWRFRDLPAERPRASWTRCVPPSRATSDEPPQPLQRRPLAVLGGHFGQRLTTGARPTPRLSIYAGAIPR